MKVTFPLRLGRGQNDRDGIWGKVRRVRSEKSATGFVLATEKHRRPKLPCTVRIVRIAPSGGGLDGDNLSSSCKNVRDAIAAWFNVDDATKLIEWVYAQEVGPWGVRIEAE